MNTRIGLFGLALTAAALLCTGIARADESQKPDDSPLAAARGMLGELEKQGKDVKALRAEVDALAPEWDEIAHKRAEMEALVEKFRPRLESVMKRVSALGGGESPIVAIGRMLDQLGSAGRDVTALRHDLEALRPDWDAIASAQARIQQANDAQRPELEKALQERVKTFQPRVEALAHRAQELAQSGPPSTAGAATAH